MNECKWVPRLRPGRFKECMCDAAWCAPWAPLRWLNAYLGRYNKIMFTFLKSF